MVEKSVNNFSLSLLNLSEEGNAAFSGLSAYIAMAAAAYGSRGSTRNALMHVLPMIHENNDEDEQNFINIMKQLIQCSSSNNIATGQTEEEQRLVTATRILVSDNCNIDKSYIEDVRRIFETQVVKCDFIKDAERVINDINKWVSAATFEKIKNISLTFGVDTQFVILNAIYFVGKWITEFISEGENYFFNYGTTPKLVAMMSVKNVYTQYYKAQMNDDKKNNNDSIVNGVILSLKNYNVSFELIVPQDREYFAKRPAFNFDEYFAKRTCTLTKVDVCMPKFCLEHECDMVTILQALGFDAAFGHQANFSAITGCCESFGITNVKQKVVVEVNEKGVEVAAVTSIVSDSMHDVVNKQVIVNRPFLFLIRDTKTEVLLFVGRVMCL